MPNFGDTIVSIE